MSNRDEILYVINNLDNLRKEAKIKKYKNIKISNKCKKDILPGMIPEGIENIIVGSQINQDLNKKNLPSTVKKLTVGYSYKKDLTNLPESIEELIVGYKFQGRIDNLPNLKKLVIKSKYTQKLPYLPNTKIYMYDFEPNVFKNYQILVKKCTKPIYHVNNENLMKIKIIGNNSIMYKCKEKLHNLFCCCSANNH